MSTDRKQIIRDYKQRASCAGVFAVRCAATGETWVGTSQDLARVANRERFFLRQGAHRDLALQACWTAHGDEGIAFETLDAMPEDVPEIEAKDWLKRTAARRVSELGARVLLP